MPKVRELEIREGFSSDAIPRGFVVGRNCFPQVLQTGYDRCSDIAANVII
jgi:hypothetical protein